eukprot:6174431-Pyramimonas_sp.AAC.1
MARAFSAVDSDAPPPPAETSQKCSKVTSKVLQSESLLSRPSASRGAPDVHAEGGGGAREATSGAGGGTRGAAPLVVLHHARAARP